LPLKLRPTLAVLLPGRFVGLQEHTARHRIHDL
jgi:hypothetical protein